MKFETVDEYMMHASAEQLPHLKLMRETIRRAIPEADEVISYNMPAYNYKQILVYFAGYPGHVGYYPTPSGIEAFKPQIRAYKHAKGSIQFPLDQPLPVELIFEMAQFRLKEVIN